jgi:hypothetical protein
MGQYIRQELHQILETNDLILGATDEEIERVVPQQFMSKWMLLKTGWKGPSDNTYGYANLK